MINALKDMRIGLRIIIGNVMSLILMAGVAFFAYMGLERVANSNSIAHERQTEVSELRMYQLHLKNMVAYQVDFIVEGDQVEAQAFRNTIPALRESSRKLRNVIDTEEEKINLNIIDRQAEEFISLFTNKIIPAQQAGDAEALNVFKQQSFELVAQMDPFIQNMIAQFGKKAERAYQEAQAIKQQTLFAIVLLTALASTAVFVSGLVLSRTITNGARQILLAIDQKHRTEEALRASQDVFRQVVQAAPWGMHFYELSSNGDLVITDSNPAADRILGIEGKTLAGKKMQDAFPEIDFNEILPTLMEVLNTNTRWDVDQIPYQSGNRKNVFELHAFQIGSRQLVVAFLDVSERQRIEKEREGLVRELGMKNKELESIVYATSHDLRSPLLNVTGFSNLLRGVGEDLTREIQALNVSEDEKKPLLVLLQGRFSQSLHYIITSASKMEGLINGLLRLSRLGRISMSLETIDMKHLIRSVIDSLQYQKEKAGAVIETGDLPDCLADAGMISQVFTNLIDNAIKYREPTRPLRIQIWGQIKKDQAVYCVADNGIGISPEHQEKIWELFHRLNPDGDVAGEGLGLSLVLKILERNHGSIQVESEAGIGSRFFVHLPLAEISMKRE